MRLKKWNARLSILTTVFLFIHTGYKTVTYLIFYYNPMMAYILGYPLAVLIVLHAILSGVCVFALHDSKSVTYAKLNARTLIQRISAVTALLLTPLHIFSFGLLQNSAGSFFYHMLEICGVLFFGSIFCHVCVSFSNAFITLGLLQDMKKKKMIDMIMYIICTLAFISVSIIIVKTHGAMMLSEVI